MIEIREAIDNDFDNIWTIFHSVVKKGDTYAFSPETTKEEAYDIWMKKPVATYAAASEGNISGTYFIKENQPGLGAHVCNSGFMVHPERQGQGIGKAMGEHAMIEAVRLGFNAMQFNCVVSTNTRAVELWKKLGFDIAGTLPKAFQHRQLGLVDAYVMYKLLSCFGHAGECQK